MEKGGRIVCVEVPSYGKFLLGSVYKVNKIDGREVLVRDEKNERKNFAVSEESVYYWGKYFRKK